jgi:redox-sensitive bicupin YhaK (pirin superfamily)
MNTTFVLPAAERGYNKFLSTGESSSYIAGHPEATLTRHSSFNFGPYQSGHKGFGKLRAFGDEIFSGPGCGYNIHRHHNFIICAFVLNGQLTHINTVGNIDQLSAGDYYAFSAGAGGKHSELNLRSEDANIIYIWILPDQLLLPPSYARGRFDAVRNRNRLVVLAGNADGALRLAQNVKISRLSSDRAMTLEYALGAEGHGLYAFVIEGQAWINDTTLSRRDSTGLWATGGRVKLRTGAEDTDLLLVESAP